MALPASPFGLDAAGGERLRFSGAEFLVKASADTTGGSFSIVEEIEPLDTPLHVHEHEIFHVLEGRACVHRRGRGFRRGPGRAGLRPARRAARPAARRPACGADADPLLAGRLRGFFRELWEAEAAGAIGPEVYGRVSARYGITWL